MLVQAGIGSQWFFLDESHRTETFLPDSNAALSCDSSVLQAFCVHPCSDLSTLQSVRLPPPSPANEAATWPSADRSTVVTGVLPHPIGAA